ncbi:MAG TPA: lytic transglycosylase domain-containing protein [Acidobacteriaceae bacterium]|nr:lytic transglycosylase domain-containing protein [Acidobacteriaceae bacterium]
MRTYRKLALHGALTALIASTAVLRAAERVTLRSGSALICDHQRSVDGLVRLYIAPSDESYLDVAAADIVAVESVSPEALTPSASPQPSQAQAAAPVDIPALLHQAGAEHHLDPDLLASVVHAESDGRTHAVSRVGARGLMQLMPATAKDLGVRDSFVAQQNIAAGTAYLDALLMYYHDDIELALAAYNAGPAAVNRYHGIPPYAETRRYVERVIHDFNQRKLREARGQSKHSPLLSIAVIADAPAK